MSAPANRPIVDPTLRGARARRAHTSHRRPSLARTARIGAALATGAMLHFTLRLQPIAGLMWLAPPPLLVAAFCASAAETRGLALLAGVVGVSGNFSYYATTSHGVLVPFLIIGLQSLARNAVIRRTRATVITAWHWTAPLIYPTTWAALDMMINTLSPHGSWGSLAYTQLAFPPVLQIAALTARGARVVALPEKIDTLNAADADAIRRHLGQIAQQHGILSSALSMAVVSGSPFAPI
ncbi:MAG: hypothetical protein M0P19_13120 [Nevskia sp.]|nr:hypothetical protein [Nevskia sp.]MCK9384266.1 hypothetical protein [Nevskia sp.]